jgi:hypothetical protein
MEQLAPPPSNILDEPPAPKDLADEITRLRQLQQGAASYRNLHGPGSPEEANLNRQIEDISPQVREISDLEAKRDGYYAKIDAARDLHGAGSPEEASLRLGIDQVEARLSTILDQYHEN